jgi:PhnB protein
MNPTPFTDFAVDRDNRTINVEREFEAPLPLVWAAWTEKDILDQWWAPKPWQAKTKWMDFSEGGYWLYAMVGPEGETHWARADFRSIAPLEGYTALDGFCDEHGTINPDLPRSLWATRFTGRENRARVNIQITFEKLEDLEELIRMGFKEGFAAGLQNLDHYLRTQSGLRGQARAEGN